MHLAPGIQCPSPSPVNPTLITCPLALNLDPTSVTYNTVIKRGYVYTCIYIYIYIETSLQVCICMYIYIYVLSSIEYNKSESNTLGPISCVAYHHKAQNFKYSWPLQGTLIQNPIVPLKCGPYYRTLWYPLMGTKSP